LSDIKDNIILNIHSSKRMQFVIAHVFYGLFVFPFFFNPLDTKALALCIFPYRTYIYICVYTCIYIYIYTKYYMQIVVNVLYIEN